MEYQSSINTPLGFLIIESNGNALTGLYFSEIAVQEENSCKVIEDCKSQLHDYFSGKLVSFNLPLHPEGTDFQVRVWSELMRIHYGETITYRELAVRLGDQLAVRAVGTANGRNPIAVIIPCHRVIGAGNKLTGYAGGIWRKQWLLAHEIVHKPNKHTLF